MIEEIKKEIYKLPLYSKSTPRPTIDYLDIMAILDKYQDRKKYYEDKMIEIHQKMTEQNGVHLKYKKAWEDLKNQPTRYITKYLDKLGSVETKTLKELIKELERKYNLGGE